MKTMDGNHAAAHVSLSLIHIFSGGSLYDTNILEIVKGQRGLPGELSGVITYANRYQKGMIQKNTRVGIFGQADAGLAKELTGTPVEVA